MADPPRHEPPCPELPLVHLLSCVLHNDATGVVRNTGFVAMRRRGHDRSSPIAWSVIERYEGGAPLFLLVEKLSALLSQNVDIPAMSLTKTPKHLVVVTATVIAQVDEYRS